MILATLAAAASVYNCTPVTGAERLWENPGTRYVMVGETHGTNETPELFADLVCAASKERPLVVALEQPPQDQIAIDAFLKSDGGAIARAQFLKAGMWNGSLKDGRSSQAMLALFEQLRRLKQSGRVKAVIAFNAPLDYDPGGSLATLDGRLKMNDRDNELKAEAIEAAEAANPGTLVLGYAGSVHVSLDDHFAFEGPIHSAAARLPRTATVTVFVDGEEGTAWNCQNLECASRPQQSQSHVCEKGVRQVMPLGKGGQPSGFDAIACVGKPFTASPPAVPATGK